ncbi:MAG: universal stress protein [Anaerolineae bacterium]|jgi:nucleotide-binding universal stress UspA family protein
MSYLAAVVDFQEARRQATMEQILARLTGRPVDLLPYDEVRQKLKAQASSRVELKEIPLDAIVGSVGRYTDFTRSFLPRSDDNKERWARVQAAVHGLQGLPPIEVYQIGDAYFVRDGNHRVSVAHQMGASHIQAYVTEVESRVPLEADADWEDVVLKAEYAAFLEHTNLDQIRPGADLRATLLGRYEKIEEHIRVHQYYMGLDREQEIPWEAAVGHWYDAIYQPVVDVIRRRGILRDFAGRTETDLYVWVVEHRAALEEAYGWQVGTEAAAADLATQHSPRAQRVVARVSERIRDALTPDELETGPVPGQWRDEHETAGDKEHIFTHILVPIGGGQKGWCALDQALTVARREGGRLLGLHVVPIGAEAEEDSVQALRREFQARCQAAGIQGKLVVEAGKVARTIVDRARWADLVAVHLAHPPGSQPLARLSSGFRTLLRLSPAPVLAVPGRATGLERALLAYDGSLRSREALYVACYLAGSWGMSLTVVSVAEGNHVDQETLAEAGAYLESCGLAADLVAASGPVADTILKEAEARDCDLILVGGYGHSPMVEIVLGSTVDQVLRESCCPVLICR